MGAHVIAGDVIFAIAGTEDLVIARPKAEAIHEGLVTIAENGISWIASSPMLRTGSSQ